MQIDSLIGQLVASGIALLFAAAAGHKLVDWQRFTNAVAGYRVLPDKLTKLIAPIIVVIELATVLLLSVPASRSLGACVAAALLLVYAASIALNLKRGRTRIDCGCVGLRHRQRISSALCVRNGLLAALALVAALPGNRRELEAVDWLTIAGGVVTLALLYAIAEQLLANRADSVSTHGARA